MNTRDHPCIYELWKYFLEQSKSFVLHQNQVSSCKGYGYWFKKFKDFPSQSSDGAPSFWSLFVATFRPTLDSTFNIITTRLEPVRLEPSAPSHISSSWWPHDVDSVSQYLLSVSPVSAGCGQETACGLRCSPLLQGITKSALSTLLSSGCCLQPTWAADVRSRCSVPGSQPSDLSSLLPCLKIKSTVVPLLLWKPWNNQNPKSVVTLGWGVDFNILVGGKQLSSDKALLLFMELWENWITWNFW